MVDEGEVIMMYANQVGYSDIAPFEIVNRVSDKTIEIRGMTATRDESVVLKFVPGGFAGHCINQNEQKWDIKSDPSAPVSRIRLSKNKGWRDKFGNKFILDKEPVAFYDYNF